MARDLNLALERLNQLHKAQVAAAPPRRRLAGAAEARLGLTHTAGDDVIDLVTGEKGVILAGNRQTALVSTTE